MTTVPMNINDCDQTAYAQECNAEARAAVQGRTPVLPGYGELALDEEPDVREVLLLADDVRLDELLALQCVLVAQAETGEVSAATGAGIYFEERRGVLTALCLLLQAQVMSVGSLPPAVAEAVQTFNGELLGAQSGGGAPLLVQRLIELLKSHPLEGGGTGRLPLVVDRHGRTVERSALVARELSLLAEALLYACYLAPRLPPAEVVALAGLVRHLGLKLRAPGGADLAQQQQASLALLAALLPLLPLDASEGGEREADEAGLRALAGSRDADARLGAEDDVPHCRLLRLAWGVLLSQWGPEAAAERGAALVAAACEGGALAFLRSGVLESVPMQDEPDHQRQLCAGIANQLLMAYLDSPAGRAANERLTQLSMEQGWEELAAAPPPAAPGGGAGAAGAALMLVDAGSGGGGAAAQLAPAAPRPDSLASLLGALAATYRLHPDLFLEEGLRDEAFGLFMGDVSEHPDVLSSSPSAFLAYLEVLTALAQGEQGARSMFTQLRPEHAGRHVSWARMFQSLLAIIRKYVPEGDAQATNAPGAVQHQLAEFVLPAVDAAAVSAYLALFAAVMGEGAADEVPTWLRQLEEDAGVSPVWEALFQAMCCPVPQGLKAALDAAVASLARRPDLAGLLWERLAAAVVVAPLGGAEAAAVPRYDISYQLNEIEARAEDYSEALAFVRLLNTLWRASGPGLPDAGRGVAHFSKFVREDVLSSVFQRAYKDEGQRWQLVQACFEHAELVLLSLRSVAALAPEVAAHAGVKPPGLDVLLDVLGERGTMRAAMSTLLAQDVDGLARERHAAPHGAAKEAAVLAALRLLRRVFERDAELVAALVGATLTGVYETLDGVLRHDRRRVPTLLDYARYPHNPAVQAEAVRIAAHLSDRVSNLVALLENAPGGGASAPLVQRLQDGFAACLQASLFSTQVSVSVEEEVPEGQGAAEEEGGDPRAALVLQLLLGALEQPLPNLAHLLCGFEAESGMGDVFLPDPRTLYTPLRVVLDALQAPGLAARRPLLYEQCLELLYELAASPDTGAATLGLLRSYYASLMPLLDLVACAPLPPAAPARASSLHQRAWLLQLHALELHRGLAGQGRSRMADVLDLVASAEPEEPVLGQDAPADVRRVVAGLDLEALLSSTLTVDQGGVRSLSHRGDLLYDVVALKDELLRRYNEWVARHGAASEALREACRLALRHAQQANAYLAELGGQAALLAAWQALLVVAFTRRFELLAAVAEGASPTELALEAAEEVLRVLGGLVAGDRAGLAALLCEALAALMARLQEQVSAAATADPLGGVPLPARCHALLRALLAALWGGRRLEAVRLPLYSALSSYLAMCRGPALLRAPPSVVEALLQGLPGAAAAPTGAAQQLDQLQRQLEDGNAALLQAAPQLVDLLAGDATSSEPATAARALSALCTLLGADPGGAVVDEVYRTALPGRLLQELAEGPYAALTQPPPRGQALLLVIEAQLTLLLRLALAGPPAARAASAQRLFSLQALPRLTQCRALDLQPEEPGFAQLSGAASLRARLHALFTPALRLALSIASALPASGPVREQAGAFVDAHTRALVRVLYDAASPGVRGWEPGDAELEEATLAVQLLSELAGQRPPLAIAPQLQEAAYRLSARFLCLSAKSQSPVVARLHAARDAGRLSARDERTYSKVLGLRCALAHHLHELTAGEAPAALLRCATGPGGVDAPGLVPTLFLLKDALVEAVLEDLPEVLGELPALEDALRAGEPAAAAELAQVQGPGSPGGAPPGPAGARAAVTRATAARTRQLARLLYLVEHLLAIVFNHLRLCLPPPALGGGAAAAANGGALLVTPGGGGGGAGQLTPGALGSERDLEQLRRLLEPVVIQLERLGAASGAGASLLRRADGSSLALLVRRTKEYLLSLA
eukprot:scaffold6.g2898.t1